MLYSMGRSLWFGAVSSQRAFAGVVVSVRDEGTPSLPSFAPIRSWLLRMSCSLRLR